MTTESENTEKEVKEPENDEFLDFDLKELGIDPAMLEGAKAMIPQLVAGLVRGVPQFMFEDRVVQESLQKSTQEKAGLLVQTIFSVRTFLLTVMGFSLTAIGIAASLLISEKVTVSYLYVLYGGIALLGLNVLGSVIYILYIHTVESNMLLKQLNFDRSLSRELQEMIQTHYHNPIGTFDQIPHRKEKAS